MYCQPRKFWYVKVPYLSLRICSTEGIWKQNQGGHRSSPFFGIDHSSFSPPPRFSNLQPCLWLDLDAWPILNRLNHRDRPRKYRRSQIGPEARRLRKEGDITPAPIDPPRKREPPQTVRRRSSCSTRAATLLPRGKGGPQSTVPSGRKSGTQEPRVFYFPSERG